MIITIPILMINIDMLEERACSRKIQGIMIGNRFERMYFADPHVVPDNEEPLMNEPHGYLTGDDVKSSGVYLCLAFGYKTKY